MTQKMAEFFDLLMGFRKFLIMLAIFVVATVFRVQNHIDSGGYVDLMKACVLGFFGSNSVEHFASMAKTYLESKTV